MHVLILGAGYVGRPLAKSFQMSGHRVTCWVRSEASAALLRSDGHAVVVGDLSDDWIWGGLIDDWEAAVFCASSSGGGTEAFQNVHDQGLNLAVARTRGVRRFIYTSSTSVYAQDDGSEVTEDSPADAGEANARILRNAEETVLGAWGTVLRLSGIYGPERAVYWSRYVLGGAVPPGDPQRWVNMIHLADAVSAIRHVLDRDEAMSQIYNVTDNLPVRLDELLGWLRRQAPGGAVVPGEGSPAKRRPATSKRISNKKLRSTGWMPLFPTFKEGYGPLVKRI